MWCSLTVFHEGIHASMQQSMSYFFSSRLPVALAAASCTFEFWKRACSALSKVRARRRSRSVCSSSHLQTFQTNFRISSWLRITSWHALCIPVGICAESLCQRCLKQWKPAPSKNSETADFLEKLGELARSFQAREKYQFPFWRSFQLKFFPLPPWSGETSQFCTSRSPALRLPGEGNCGGGAQDPGLG